MSTSTPPSRTTCVVRDLLLGSTAGDVAYSVQPHATHRLVPSQIRLEIDNIHASARVFKLPKDCLPFGLVNSFRLIGMPEGAGSVTLRVTKATGIAECNLSAPRWRAQVGVGNSTLFTAQDVPHPELKEVLDATGHVMTWRMLPGTCIGEIFLNLSSAPPPKLYLVVFGANAVALDTEAQERPRLLLPPLSPAARLAKLERVTAEVSRKAK